jgi:hypothetical protein
MSTYAHLLPILFLSTVVICLWCVSSIKPLNVSVARFTLALTYLFLLGFYCVYFMNVNSLFTILVNNVIPNYLQLFPIILR